jgi:hypothetical protein
MRMAMAIAMMVGAHGGEGGVVFCVLWREGSLLCGELCSAAAAAGLCFCRAQARPLSASQQ